MNNKFVFRLHPSSLYKNDIDKVSNDNCASVSNIQRACFIQVNSFKRKMYIQSNIYYLYF